MTPGDYENPNPNTVTVHGVSVPDLDPYRSAMGAGVSELDPYLIAFGEAVYDHQPPAFLGLRDLPAVSTVRFAAYNQLIASGVRPTYIDLSTGNKVEFDDPQLFAGENDPYGQITLRNRYKAQYPSVYQFPPTWLTVTDIRSFLPSWADAQAAATHDPAMDKFVGFNLGTFPGTNLLMFKVNPVGKAWPMFIPYDGQGDGHQYAKEYIGQAETIGQERPVVWLMVK